MDKQQKETKDKDIRVPASPLLSQCTWIGGLCSQLPGSQLESFPALLRT